MSHLYEILLEKCINKAWEFQTLTLPNPSVGAMVVLDSTGEILSLEAHQKSGTPHAEVLALLSAFKALLARGIIPKSNSIQDALSALEQNPLDSAAIHKFLSTYHSGAFYDTTLLLTLEPCNHFGKTPPCSALVATLKPKRVVIAARDVWGNSANGSDRLKEAGIEVVFIDSIQGVNSIKKKAQDLLYPFLCWQKKGGFCLFKLAMRLDGDYKSGQISSPQARIFTHNQRCIAKNLVISGASVRTDKPTLDTRYAQNFYAHNTKAPDICILTTKSAQDFDKNIPLFSVQSRNVNIINDKNTLYRHIDRGFCVIEGGFHFYKVLCTCDTQEQESTLISYRQPADMLLIHIAPNLCLNQKSSDTSNHQATISRSLQAVHYNLEEFEILHTMSIQQDLLLWLKICP